MDFFDTHLKDTESLFKDEMALDHEYVPKFIKFRENEQQLIADTIKPLLQKRTATNLFITGSPGLGKTLAVKHVLREMVEKGLDENIFLLYVNCWKKDTAHKIILEICNQLNYKFVINKTTDQLIKEVSKIINTKSSVIVLDEIDKLESAAFSILYSLLEDIYRKSIILITNNKNFLTAIDQRISSRLTPETVEFKSYTKSETHQILKERVGYAFVPKIFNEEALELISKKTFQLQDIRTGLFLLRETGNIVERKLKKLINKEDAEEAINKLTDFKIKQDLTGEQDKLFEIVKNNPGKSTIEIHSLYDSTISYRTFLRKINTLEKARLINIKEENLGKSKKTFIFLGD